MKRTDRDLPREDRPHRFDRCQLVVAALAFIVMLLVAGIICPKLVPRQSNSGQLSSATDEKVRHCEMTIECRDRKGNLLKTLVDYNDYIPGTYYEIEAPEVAFREPIIASQTGVVPDGDFVVIFTYDVEKPLRSDHEPASDTDAAGDEVYSVLTTEYRDTSNNVLLEPQFAIYGNGEYYAVRAPAIAGYLPLDSELTGTMPQHDLTIVVYYERDYSQH